MLEEVMILDEKDKELRHDEKEEQEKWQGQKRKGNKKHSGTKKVCVWVIALYLVWGERDQYADASRQSGVDQGLWTSRDQSGFLER